MPEVMAIGETLIDFSPVSADADGYPTIAAHPGGAVANFLAALAAEGITAGFYTKVGRDRFGDLLVRTLAKYGIDTRGVVRDPDAFTTLAFVTLDEHGDRAFSFARKPGADTRLAFPELDLSLLDSARAFHFGSLSLTDEPARSATKKAVTLARARGKLVTCDPNLRLPLWDSPGSARREMLWSLGNADIVKISEDEIRFLFGCGEQEGALHVLGLGAKLCFVTLGKRGCYARNHNAAVYTDNFNGVKTVDTTGAGDIFGGTAVAGVLRSGRAPGDLDADTLSVISRRACAAASLSTAKYGGISSIPSREEVNALLSP